MCVCWEHFVHVINESISDFLNFTNIKILVHMGVFYTVGVGGMSLFLLWKDQFCLNQFLSA